MQVRTVPGGGCDVTSGVAFTGVRSYPPSCLIDLPPAPLPPLPPSTRPPAPPPQPWRQTGLNLQVRGEPSGWCRVSLHSALSGMLSKSIVFPPPIPAKVAPMPFCPRCGVAHTG
ncbi:hypothetical protein E2C01_021310 [Portunus trituberculatus]|uniref:Uncharacterized protein n=1 Tax=Portunus trituberculatus TaxID=210409 RepID=A0A5B7E417_PORTR|nr:hypothetical protein [Portunus trituberculatus]